MAVVDFGVQYTNPDLMDQYDFTSAYNLMSSSLLNSLGLHAGGSVGLPVTQAVQHGTSCAGLIAAKPDNNFCGVGIAHGAKYTSIVPHGPPSERDSIMSDAYIANGLTYRYDNIDIYSNSWGPPDLEILYMKGPGRLTKLSLRLGAERGRKGKGTIAKHAPPLKALLPEILQQNFLNSLKLNSFPPYTKNYVNFMDLFSIRMWE